MTTKNPETLKNSESPKTKEELNMLEKQVSGDRTKFETLKNSEMPKTKQELKTLKLNTSKDYEKFKTLSKNPTLKKGLNKLFDKSSKEAFSEEWKHYEKLNVGKTIENILKKYPDLRFEISGKLGIPLSERKFSNLSLQQKLNFTALHESIFGKNILYKKNPSSKDIVARINSNKQNLFNRINRQFKRKNINNFLDLERTLKDFGLNQDEVGKLKEYLLIIKEHPEFIYGPYTTLKAGDGKYYIGIAIGSLLVGIVLGVLGKTRIDNLGKLEPQTTTDLTVPDVVRVEDPKGILESYVVKGKFGDDPEHPIIGRKEINMFTIEDNDAWWTKWAKEKVNIIQSRELVMKLSGDVLGGFDLDKGCQIDIEQNYPSIGKGVVYVQLPEPDILITNDKAEVISEKLERIHLSEFKNAQEELRSDLRNKAQAGINNDKEFYNKIREEMKTRLTRWFKAMKPYGVNVDTVKIRFFDPEKGEYPIEIKPHDILTDPENKNTIKIKK